MSYNDLRHHIPQKKDWSDVIVFLAVVFGYVAYRLAKSIWGWE